MKKLILALIGLACMAGITAQAKTSPPPDNSATQFVIKYDKPDPINQVIAYSTASDAAFQGAIQDALDRAGKTLPAKYTKADILGIGIKKGKNGQPNSIYIILNYKVSTK
jgi:hypothetical protein